MAAEDQVIQIYAATNGYLDRIVVDKVEQFLEGLTASIRGNEPDLLKKIASGDWGEETENAVDKAVRQYAEDFGFDLDEEGHPLEEGEDGREERPQRTEPDEGVEAKSEEEEAVPA